MSIEPTTTVLELPSAGALTISRRLSLKDMADFYKAANTDRKGRLKTPADGWVLDRLANIEGCRHFVWILAREHNPGLTLQTMTTLIREGDEADIANRIFKLITLPAL